MIINRINGFIVTPIGRVFSPSGKRVSEHKNHSGYVRVNIPGRGRPMVHRLVAECYLAVVPGKDEVNHKDGDKSNNRVDNLEWCTRKENMAHARASGLWKPPVGGEGAHNAKLSSRDVEIIRARFVGGRRRTPGPGSASTLAKEFGIDTSNVYLIVKNKTRSKG